MPAKRNRPKPTNENSASGAHYEVGYGRPPIKHQFQPKNKMGKGRPKGRKNEATIINEVLQRRITLTENGKPSRVTWEEAMWTQQGRQAVRGDHKATALLSDRKRRAEELIVENDKLGLEDQEAFDDILDILVKRRMSELKLAKKKAEKK